MSADDVWVLRDPLSGAPTPQRVTETAFVETIPRISPDGRWIAYESNQSGGQLGVHIESFPQPGIKIQISSSGGMRPRWKADSKELFYVTPDDPPIVTASLQSDGASLAVKASVPLFATRMHSTGLGRNYSVSADGRFLINVAAGEQAPAPITVIHNWAASQTKWQRRYQRLTPQRTCSLSTFPFVRSDGRDQAPCAHMRMHVRRRDSARASSGRCGGREVQRFAGRTPWCATTRARLYAASG